MKSFNVALAILVAAGLLASAGCSAASAKLQCEDLPVDLCAFSVSSAGFRCLLEKKILTSGHVEFECQTSNVGGADEFAEWVETDECVQSCGIERMSIGISSDALVEKGFAKALCSHSCQHNCPNIVDLFTNLADGEGVPLRQVCEAQNKVARREMEERVLFASLSIDTVSEWVEPDVEAPTPAPSI